MAPFYPFYTELSEIVSSPNTNFSKGNFGLWYNKMIPNSGHNSAWSACDENGNKDKKIEHYKKIYNNIKTNPEIRQHLEQKHCRQIHYGEQMQNNEFIYLAFTGTLESALITGIGESHPGEISLVLDHTMGIPYIPASGIKGMVRFAHSKNLLFDDNGDFTDKFVTQGKNKQKKLIQILDEENPDTYIPLFFGGDIKTSNSKKTETVRGKIIFMDAYPVSVPELREDIINPHYSKYYADDNEAPGDWQDPVPVKFLTIAPETEFIFRFIMDTKSAQYKKQFEQAVIDALEKEGIGAKTAVGYGRFKKLSKAVPKSIKDEYQKYTENMLTKEEKRHRKIQEKIKKIKNTDKNNQSAIDSLFHEWCASEVLIKENKDIAKAFLPKFNKKKSNGDYTKQYKIISEILGNENDVAETSKEKNTEKQKPSGFQKDKKIVKKLENIIARGFCSRRECNRIITRYKKDYPELCSKIKHLPNQKQ